MPQSPAAVQMLEQALGIFGDLGNRVGQANALSDLGDVRRLTDDFPAAAQVLEQALGIFRDFGDRLGQANALRSLGVVRRLTDDYPAAAQNLDQALRWLVRSLGKRRLSRCTFPQVSVAEGGGRVPVLILHFKDECVTVCCP
jgi:tetratricopeptide (TPR) repeat protein